jgi:hypothetical protein
MMTRTLLVSLAIALGAVSGLRCATDQEQTPRPPGDREQEQQQQQQGPRLTLEPASGSPGSGVTAKGSGFRGDCRARLYFDTESGPLLGSADVDRSGSFSARLTIPEKSTGDRHLVLARGLRPGTDGCTAPSDNRAEAPFSLTPPRPRLVIDTLEARPGTTVHVEGRGFCADPGCSAVTVLIDGQVAAGDVKVSPQGSFSAEARVPAIKTAGEIVVAAVQTLADKTEIRVFGELEVTPRPNARQRPVQ